MKRRLITVFFLGIALFAILRLSNSEFFSDYTEISAVSSAHANTDRQIFGQVYYDKTNSIPNQANLTVQLIEQDHNGIEKVVNETHLTASPSGTTEFKLPIHINELKSKYTYSLKARITFGDSLIYVSETPTMISLQQSGYVIHLASIGQGQSITSQSNEIIGSKWVALEIDNVAVIEGTDINLTIDKAQTPILGINNNTSITNHYNVSGSDGCNRFSSTAIVNESKQTLSFNPLGMTFMACAQALNQQEIHFANMISNVHSYAIDQDNILNLKDKYNKIIARFMANNSI